jgi:phosphoglycolate phosphatase-like HAD superfamily hydrolase
LPAAGSGVAIRGSTTAGGAFCIVSLLPVPRGTTIAPDAAGSRGAFGPVSLLISRYKLDPSRAVFIDDSEKDIASAHAAGLIALQFTDSEKLRSDLINLGLSLQARSS